MAGTRRELTADSSDGSRRAARWLDAGLMDLEFYGALRAREFGDRVEAAEDFVSHGMSQRLSPHPLLDFVSLPTDIRQAWRRGEVESVLAHLAGADGRACPSGPLAEPEDPVSVRASMVALAQELGRDDAGGPGQVATVDWPAVAARDLQPGLTSVVLVADEPRRTVRTVEHLLERGDGSRMQIVVVDCGSPPHAALHVHASLCGMSDVELLRVSGTAPAGGAMNLGIARVTGEVLILLGAQVVVRRGWLPAVLAAIGDPEVAGAQPVVLRSDDTIDSAGLVVTAAGRRPTPLLAGHQKEDARRLQGQHLAAISGELMVLRTHDVVALQGVNARMPRVEAALDLCARLAEQHPAGFRVAPSAFVSASVTSAADAAELPPHPRLHVDPRIHERIGFTTERSDSVAGGDDLELRVTGRRRERPAQLRWSLKLPSAPGARGDRWGDSHFGDALARALSELGQDAVTCRRGAHAVGPTFLDDVAVAVRGLYPIPPTPGQVNVLWVISHPDDVHPDEFEGYDLVFAASHLWSQALSGSTGREVIPLMQATEFESPVPAQTHEEAGVVFVGASSRERERPLVWKAVEAGVRLAVYGPGWEALPDGVWCGDHVDNRLLPALYRRHGIVLADHWADMARHGFIANRVFDAVASGARVICDDVAGVHQVFDKRDVVVARTPEDIAVAVADLGRPEPREDVPRPPLTFLDRARIMLDRVSTL